MSYDNIFAQVSRPLADPRGPKRPGHPAPCSFCMRDTWNGVPLVCDACWRRQSPAFRAWETLTEIRAELDCIFSEGEDVAWEEHFTAVTLRMVHEQVGELAHMVRVNAAKRTHFDFDGAA